MRILFDSSNLLHNSRKKKLKDIDLFKDVVIPGGMVAIHVANKVGLLFDSKVKIFKDRKVTDFKPHITTIKDFLS